MTNASSDVRIVIADDDSDILNLLCYILEREGYDVTMATNGADAFAQIQSVRPDLAVLDVMMPELDGFGVAKYVRQTPEIAGTPILMLTALDDESKEVEGLDAGADAYLPKPIAPRRLMSHVRALLRRARTADVAADADLYRVHDLEIDRTEYVVRRLREGVSKAITFPRKEFELLYFMGRHPKRVFSRTELLDEVWGTDVYVMDRTIDVHISKIREKLGEGYIETIKGVGYRFRG
ncbi:MAG: response regulator transcription factor [Bacteroidota bacterium]